MEQSINRVELLGRTGNRPTLRRTPNDTPVTQFSLYTNQLWRNGGGELCEAAERHSVTAWSQLAIQCCNHLHKGSRVHITGRLHTRRWADPDFRQRVAALRSEMIGRAMGSMADAMSDAAAGLRGLLAAESESVRLGACRAILELGVRLREAVELETRIVALEQREAARSEA